MTTKWSNKIQLNSIIILFFSLVQLLASIWAELGPTQLKLVLKLYCGVIVRTVAQSQSGYHSPSMHTVMILWFDLTFKRDRLGMWTKQICIPQNAK